MADQDIPAMDYDEHERTYHTFVEATKTGAVATIVVLIAALLLSKVTTGLGMAVGIVLLVAGVVASFAGLMSSKGGWIAPAVIALLMFLQLIYVTT